MRFVKTAGEIDSIQRIYSRCHQLGVKTLTVHFETEPAAIRALLPPPLEPAPAHVGMAWVSEIGNSTCVGPYNAAGLAIRARYGDLIGNYCLSMAVTRRKPSPSDASCTASRASWPRSRSSSRATTSGATPNATTSAT